jgi:hypothetical protein
MTLPSLNPSGHHERPVGYAMNLDGVRILRCAFEVPLVLIAPRPPTATTHPLP